MRGKVLAALFGLALSLGAAHAQSSFPTAGGGGPRVPGGVRMCADATGNAVAYCGYSASVSITRTNDTNAYSANDVVGAATGSTAAVQLSGLGGLTGGEVIVTSTELEIDASAVISGETSYNLYCYNVTPPSALGDNAAFDIPSGDRTSFIGKIALGTPVDEGSTLYIRQDGINAQLKLSSSSAFCYLVTVGGYTPTAQRVYKVTLHATGL